MEKIFIFVLAGCFAVISAKATVSYNDVAVIVNTNSSASQAIGSYFQTQRNIPAANMIYVAVDTTEEIDSAMFSLLRSQVEGQLISNNIRDSVNYLVTTKGVPLKVNRGSTFSQSSPSSSVESELMLILGTYTSYIDGVGPQMSPYFNRNAHFSRATYGIYLVTRLDAYTVQEVFDLIDRSGPDLQGDPVSPFLFDQDPAWSSPLNTYMARAKTALEAKGKVAIVDPSSAYQTDQHNLLGYMSWGSNDHYQQLYTQNAIPHNTYAPGAIIETYVSTSGRSFDNPPSYGQSLISDLIAEGVSGAKGYVYEPYSNAMAHADILFDRYASNYNLAESYFMASLMISWMDVVVGDPKTSINFVQGPLPVQLTGFSAAVIPQSNAIAFTWRTVSETNNYGFFLQSADTATSLFSDIPNSFIAGHGTTLEPRDYSWTLGNVPAGTAYYRLKQVDLDGTVHFNEPVIVTVQNTTFATETAAPQRYELMQNYPNPFNPSTRISFTIPNAEFVSLIVYDVSGKKIATLVSEQLSEGKYDRTFDGAGLASGVYYYRLAAGRLIEAKKMVLMK